MMTLRGRWPKILAGLWWMLVLLLALARPLPAFDLAGVTKAALAASPTYQQAVLAVLKARNAVPDLLRLEDASLTASPVLTTDSNGALVVAMDTSLTLPVLEQLSLKASVDLDLDLTMGLSVVPLAHSATRSTALVALEEARLGLAKTGREVGLAAGNAALAYAVAERTTARAVESTRLAQLAWQDSREQNWVDPATVSADDVRSALKDLADARAAELKARTSLKAAEVTMLGIFGPAWVKDKDSWAALTLEELGSARDQLIARLPEKLGAALAGGAGDDGLPEVDSLVRERQVAGQLGETARLSALAVDKARLTLEATWAYDPALSLTGQLGLDAAGQVSWSAGLVFSLSPGDFQVRQREELAASLQILQAKAEADRESDGVEFRQALLAVALNRQSRLAQETVVAANQELHEEYRVLRDYGAASELELAQAANDLASARDGLFAALVQEYLAWLDLAGRYGLDS